MHFEFEWQTIKYLLLSWSILLGNDKNLQIFVQFSILFSIPKWSDTNFHSCCILPFPRFQFYSPVSFVKVFRVLREIVRCSIDNLFISMSFDLNSQLELLRRGELITEQNVRMLCLKAREILINEPNIQSINPPITVHAGC